MAKNDAPERIWIQKDLSFFRATGTGTYYRDPDANSIEYVRAAPDAANATPSDVDKLLYRIAAQDCARLAAGMSDCTEELAFTDWCITCQARGLLQKYTKTFAAPDAAQTVYGLMAIGNSRNGWQFKMQSKKLFVRRTGAEAFIPDFKLLCCDDKQVESARPETLNITVIERILVGTPDAVGQARRETWKAAVKIAEAKEEEARSRYRDGNDYTSVSELNGMIRTSHKIAAAFRAEGEKGE